MHPPLKEALEVAVFFASFSSDVRRNEVPLAAEGTYGMKIPYYREVDSFDNIFIKGWLLSEPLQFLLILPVF